MHCTTFDWLIVFDFSPRLLKIAKYSGVIKGIAITISTKNEIKYCLHRNWFLNNFKHTVCIYKLFLIYIFKESIR